MEFAPLDFFPSFTCQSVICEEPDLEIDLAKDDIECSRSTFQEEESSSYEISTSSKKSLKSNSSENHNMVKQLIITIKQMAGKYIKEIGYSFSSREIII